MIEPAVERDPIQHIRQLFEQRGDLVYGESVTQLEHALQCARFAEIRCERPAAITAAFLHDIGHLLHEDAAAANACGDDDDHEALAARFLAPWFGNDVIAPVVMHVAAKRYLAAVEPGYCERLSPMSLRALAMQRGPMSEAEVAAFTRHPRAAAALRLRRCDEAAKIPGAPTPPLEHYLAIAASCRRDGRRR